MKQTCFTKALISEQFVEALLCEQVLTDVMNKLRFDIIPFLYQF